eukprot:1156721-Amphidinium_carterae.1
MKADLGVAVSKCKRSDVRLCMVWGQASDVEYMRHHRQVVKRIGVAGQICATRIPPLFPKLQSLKQTGSIWARWGTFIEMRQLAETTEGLTDHSNPRSWTMTEQSNQFVMY